MEFGSQQKEALVAIREWLADCKNGEGPKVFRLFGYAGTGKTTLAHFIGDAEDAAQKEDAGEDDISLPRCVQYAAFTGKAAVVMQRKGCENARTLHSLIYTTHDKSHEALNKLTEALKNATLPGTAQNPKQVEELEAAIVKEEESLKQPGFSLKPDALTVRHWDEDYQNYVPDYRITMFIIDECSMVDARLGNDLLSYGVPVLVLGDPAQLPPVAAAGYFTSQEPDFLLTQIHRQAEGDPIIDIASKIRGGHTLQLGTYGESRVCMASDLKQEDWLAADQILVGKNATRHGINRRCRELLGHTDVLPEPGEKLVCLKNNNDDGLLNGSLWECIKAVDNGGESVFMLQAKSLDEEQRTVTVAVLKANFLGLTPDDYDMRRMNTFDFGYALTVHKAQGSQWDRVILMDEWHHQDREKWLYTGVTRAAKSITVVRR